MSEFRERITRRFHRLEATGLRRRLHPPSGIDFSSNDYLCLSTHPLLKERMAKAVHTEGCGSTGSRLLRGDRSSLQDLEQRFAAFKHSEAALYFSSGYAANLAVLTTFVDRHDLVYSDAQNHASIVDGIRLSRAKRIRFPHCDVERLAQLLRRPPGGVQKFLVTESLFSMDGDFAPLEQYAAICEETDTVLIVDEAHAVGVYGSNGSGFVEECNVDKSVFLTVNTAGKALGVSGAFAAGPLWAIDALIQQARPFIFSTAAPPPITAALDAALTVIADEPERREQLLQQSARLRALLAEQAIECGNSRSQIIPVIIGENDQACAVAAEIQAAGFDVRAIRPPTVPPGTARLRISVNVGLDDSTLQQFALTLGRTLRKVTSCVAASS